ncbi:uncharacterized protein LOC128884270 isoform X2 [Hylaeus volcanicus]|uniref:uncharacterized protein LOC128884270 isoform X2 n=1 Tax=Hylaeus volcanicus TaxID=313075 RepID=UPI0023B79BA4|nr:uncharacterized protein LOC128884270 isoform X2 [Hylaeus volcanicus]
MGVTGLWDLLSPSATRTKIDQLQSKKIAIDTSIWLVQFNKAMRDESGNLAEGAHLVGFFRRICKLLFYGIKPVFVFDGKPPVLKRKTLMQRKLLQEQQMLGLKRTAEKLLLNKLKLKTLDFVQAKKKARQENKNLRVPPGAITSSKEKMTNQQYETQNTKDDVQFTINNNTSPDFNNLFGPDLFEVEHNLLNLINKENRRSAYFNSIPKELSYALLGRKTLDDLNVDTSGFNNLLKMPTDFLKKSKNYEFLINQELTTTDLKDVKEYPIKQEDGINSFIQLPLMSSIDPTHFSHLDPTVQYSILNDIRDTWFSETRLLCIQAKDNPGVFSSLQLESFLRHVNTTKEINKVKKKIADKLHLSFLSSNGTTDAITSSPSHSYDSSNKQSFTQENFPTNLNCTKSNQPNFQRSILELNETENVPHIVTESENLSEDFSKKRKPQKARCFSEILEKQLNTKVVMPLPRLDYITEHIENSLLHQSTWSPSLQHLKSATSQEANSKVTYKMNKGKDQVLELDTGEEDKIWVPENVLDDIFSNGLHQTPTCLGSMSNVHATQKKNLEDTSVSKLGIKKKIHLMKKLKKTPLKEQSDRKYSNSLNTNMDSGSQNVETDWDTWETLEAPLVEIKKKNLKETILKQSLIEEMTIEAQQKPTLYSKNIFKGDKIEEHKNEESSPSNVPTPSFGDRSTSHKKNCCDLKTEFFHNISKATNTASQIHSSELYNPHCVALNHFDSTSSLHDSFNGEFVKEEEHNTNESLHTIGKPLIQTKASIDFPKTTSKLNYKANESSLFDAKSSKLDKQKFENLTTTDMASNIKENLGVSRNHSDFLLTHNKPEPITDDIVETFNKRESELLTKSGRPFVLYDDTSQLLSETKPSSDDEPEIHLENELQITTEDKFKKRSPHKLTVKSERESEVVSLTKAQVQSKMEGNVDLKKRKKQIDHCFETKNAGEESLMLRDDTQNFEKNNWKLGLDHQQEIVDGENVVLMREAESVTQNVNEPCVSSSIEKVKNHNISVGNDEENKLFNRVDLQINENNEKNVFFTEKSLDHQTAELETEQIQLNNLFMNFKKGTEEVTSEMLDDIKELLSLFGIPFVLAPSEAEAQCATLVQLGLCDSVITEDSDCLLFGSRVVYRHFFDPHGAIECYDMNLIESELNLTRKDIILLAMLLGCDYTVGVSGIGIVNALETIRVFPDMESLKEFREWATDLISSNKNNGILPTDSPEKRLYREKHKNYRLQWIFPDNFPSMDVWTSFTSPAVDQSNEDFSWSAIYSEGLIKFLMEKTFLTKEQILQTIQPVLQQRLKIQKNSWRQTNIKEFFSTVQLDRVAKVRSKRILKLFPSLSNNFHSKESEEQICSDIEKLPIRSTKKQKNKKQSSRKTAQKKMRS